jgi:hypothetical protein
MSNLDGQALAAYHHAMWTTILLVALVLLLLDDLHLRSILKNNDGAWLHVLGDKDERIARLKRRLRSLTQ